MWSDETLDRAARKTRIGATKASAQMLAGSTPVPPGPQASAATEALFTTTPCSQEAARLAAAVHRADNLPPRLRLTIGAKQALRMGRTLHGPAAPGGFGFRNTYICAILAQPRGPATMARWGTFWAQGRPSAAVAAVWNPSLSHPFYKSDGESVRPVVCAESLLKFAVGKAQSHYRRMWRLAVWFAAG